jgi:thiopurine S-methyltransferase
VKCRGFFCDLSLSKFAKKSIFMNLDKNYWSSRYQQDQTGWDIGFCSTPLQTYFDQLKEKNLKILIPGAGYAHEAKYLHEKGFTNVHVIDLAAEPLSHLREICPDFPESHLILGDFFELNDSYDLIVEQTFFCALDPILREQYAVKMKTLLKPQGKLVGLLFNRDFEGGPPFGGCMEEYQLLFEKHFENVSIEPCYNSIEPRKGSEVFIRIS